MHLVTILAYAILFLQADRSTGWVLVGENDVFWTLLIVLGQPLALGVAAWLAGSRAHRTLKDRPDTPQAAQLAHHHATLALRALAVLGFAADVFLTNWPRWMQFGRTSPWLQILGDLIVLSPFIAAVIAVWLAQFPLERSLRKLSLGLDADHGTETKPWTLRSYLDFNIRHHILIVAAPLTLILFAANLVRGYERPLQQWSGWVWAPDAMLGMFAICVFVMAPLILARIWQTVPLEPGPLRKRLESLCDRIGLRCRDILIWHSDGMLINAAVMGVVSPVRYVLLSDGLLETMSVRQIEAVFGHEAGHIRHRHMQHFLLFAFVGWLIVAGAMELLARWSLDSTSLLALPPLAIQGFGVLATMVFWGVGFGWLSRRFERQADWYGACCATPTAEACHLPCSVHMPRQDKDITADGRVCASGAATFCSALDRVARLNGIPHEERSWRHSSIGSRIRFLTSLAGDPNRAAGFDRLIRRIKTGMLTTAILGTVICVYYWITVTEPAILQM